MSTPFLKNFGKISFILFLTYGKQKEASF